MVAIKRIPVSESVWLSLSDMKKPGQTYDGLISEMIEHEKERRFLMEMASIEAETNYVEFAPWNFLRGICSVALVPWPAGFFLIKKELRIYRVKNYEHG